MALFNRVTIVGLGLIGGSLGIAIRRKHLAREVVGYSRKSSTLAQAKRRGAIDCGSTSLEEAVRGSDLIVLATPVDVMGPLATRFRRALAPRAIVTDVGSTKVAVTRALERVLSARAVFVGSHPLAGSEQRGIEAARADLFAGSRCILTRTRRTDPAALRRVARLWTALGQSVVVMTPQRHDQLLAAVSHVPHLIAFALMHVTSVDALALAPRSFLDATRVAKSDPALWDAILLSNRRAIAQSIDRLSRQLTRARRLITSADQPRLHRFLQHAQRLRASLHDS